MKKVILFLSVFFFCANMLAVDIEIDDYSFETSSIVSMTEKDDNVTVLLVKDFRKGVFFEPAIRQWNCKEWLDLPVKIFYKDSTEPLAPTHDSNLAYDSSGALWLGGFSLYKYENGKWTDDYIDDENRFHRIYKQICVDKFNNLWITTEVYNDEDSIYKAELLKYDRNEFKVIMQTNAHYSFMQYGRNTWSKIISAAPDGKIFVFRKMNINDDDFDPDGENPEIFVFENDTLKDRLMLKTYSGPKYDGWSKAVQYVYAETPEKIWFGLTERTLFNMEDPFKSEDCCSGLSLYENAKWTIFGPSRGLDTNVFGLTRPVFRVYKTDSGKYIVIGLKKIWEMYEDYILRPLDWSELLRKSKFIRTASVYSGEKLDAYFDHLTNPDNTDYAPRIGSPIELKNRELWFPTSKGILIIPKDIIAGKEERIYDEEISIHPNPAGSYLHVKNSIDIEKYKILSLTGRMLKNGSLKEDKIDISSLASGAYYLILSKNNHIIRTIGFIKL